MAVSVTTARTSKGLCRFVPGAKMFYHLDKAQDRADVIEFLKERAR